MRDELRERGLRLTPQRELVLTAVRTLGHATPEEIAEYIHRTHPSINLSTVYRNLETLENVGLAYIATLDMVAPLITQLRSSIIFILSVANVEVWAKLLLRRHRLSSTPSLMIMDLRPMSRTLPSTENA